MPKLSMLIFYYNILLYTCLPLDCYEKYCSMVCDQPEWSVTV